MLKKFLEKYKVNIILETLLTNIMKTLLDVSLAFERAPMLVRKNNTKHPDKIVNTSMLQVGK
jgi:hypothetical protein